MNHSMAGRGGLIVLEHLLLVKDPPNFRRGSTNWESCHFCVHAADNDRRFACLAYECFVLLDTVCDSYESRESEDPPTISRFMREVPQFKDLGWQQGSC